MNRWKTLDNVFLLVCGLIIWFAYMDSRQIIPFHTINTEQGWELYSLYTSPAIWFTWYVVIFAIGLIWYFVYKDKSESVGLVAAGWTLIFFGTQDLVFFMFSSQTLAAINCWADILIPVRIISDILGECCPTPTSFVISAVLGIFISYKLYNWLKKSKW